MVSSRRFLVGISLLAAVGLAGLAWQRQTNAGLRRELAQRQAAAREQARLEDENRRLRSHVMPPEQQAVREQERATLAGLANELEIVRRRAAAKPRVAARPESAPAPRPSLREVNVSAAEWTNAGDKSPLAALETALWAAAHGEIGTLTELMSISEPTRAQAAAVLARLPEAARGELASPEHLVAMLTAGAVPLGSAHVSAQFDDAPETARLVLQLTDLNGRPRERVIGLHATPAGWRLTVPEAEIRKYFATLQTPAGP
jgi:hypothetical protein